MNENVCRICFEEQQENRPLICPCKCSGSSKYIHYDCLETWRNTTSNEEAKKKCMECNAPYIIVNKFPIETIKINFDKNLIARNFFIQYLVSIPLILCIFALDWGLEQPSVNLLNAINPSNITNYIKNSNIHSFIYYNSLGSSLIYFIFNLLFFIVMLFCVHQKCKYLKVFPISFLNSLLSLSWLYFYFIFLYSKSMYFYFTLLTPVLNYLFLMLTFTYHNSILNMLNMNNNPQFLEYPSNTNSHPNSNREFLQISINPFYNEQIENELLIQETREIPPVPPYPPPAIPQHFEYQDRNNFSNVLFQIQNNEATLTRRNKDINYQNKYTMIDINKHMTRNHQNLQEQVIQELRQSFDSINQK